MLHNDPQPNKLCDFACVQSAFSVEVGGTIFYDMLVIDDMLVVDVIDKMLHGTQYTYQLIAF